MDRRFFLQQVLAGGAVAAAPAWLQAAADTRDARARFAARIAEYPWLVGFRTVGVEALEPITARIEGRWPSSLTGTLFRNGPAWFDRGETRYKHWFDGDGLMRAWRIGGGKVTHAARMVATRKFTHEQAVDRLEVRAAGTFIENAIPMRNNDDLNTANTSVVSIGGRLFALWEGGSAVEIDPRTLVTRGPRTWREDLEAAPFSAHPLRDANGDTWNFGSLMFFERVGLLIWHIGADGQLRRTQIIDAPAPGYIHAFAQTRNHLLFMLIPYRTLAEGRTFFEAVQFAADQPCQVAVVRKDALDKPRWFEVDFAAAYHFGDAYEDRDRIVMRVARHHDLVAAQAPMAASMRGEREPEGATTDLACLHLDLTTSRAHWEKVGFPGVEFPAFDARTPGDRGATIYAPCSMGEAEAPYFNAVGSFDATRGRQQVHRYGSRVMAEEHVFVPKPGSKRAGEGWLLGTLLDYARGRSGLAVLDAEHVDDGPIATAWLPYTTPLGFHGWFEG